MNAILNLQGACPIGSSAAVDHDFTGLVEAIGCPDFAEQLLGFFAPAGSADHVAVFEQRAFELSEIAAAERAGSPEPTRAETGMYDVKAHLTRLSHVGTRVDLGAAGAARGTAASGRQRILICARRGDAAYCIRVLRSAEAGMLSDGGALLLKQVSNFLVSIVAKHAELTLRRPNLTPALCSLEVIEECLSGGTDLSRREGEVCARILFGLSSYGIALDLGIGKESVMTYRKRAYSRLGIGSQRELLMWYLGLWSNMRGAATPEAA